MVVLPSGKPPYYAARVAFEAMEKARGRAGERRALAFQLTRLKESYTLSTWRTVLRDLRALLIQSNREHLIGLCVLSVEEVAQHQVQYARTLAERHLALRPLSAAKFLDAAERAALSADGPSRAAGLLALSGRRLHEIWHTAKLSSAPGRGRTFAWSPAGYPQPRRWWLTFDGQAKARDREVEPYPIPVLAPAADVQRLFLRWDEAPLPSNAHWHRKINQAVANLFGERMSAKQLRAAYAAVAAFHYKPVAMTDTLFYAHILGHRVHPADDPDLETAASYMVFSVTA